MYKLLAKDSALDLETGIAFPFTDGNKQYEEYKVWKVQGNTPEPMDVYVAPTPTVVTKLQLMEAMLKTDVTTTSNMWLDFKAIRATNELLSDYWSSTQDVNRNHPMTLGMIPLMNKTEADLDALFLLASTK